MISYQGQGWDPEWFHPVNAEPSKAGFIRFSTVKYGLFHHAIEALSMNLGLQSSKKLGIGDPDNIL